MLFNKTEKILKVVGNTILGCCLSIALFNLGLVGISSITMLMSLSDETLLKYFDICAENLMTGSLPFVGVIPFMVSIIYLFIKLDLLNRAFASKKNFIISIICLLVPFVLFGICLLVVGSHPYIFSCISPNLILAS